MAIVSARMDNRFIEQVIRVFFYSVQTRGGEKGNDHWWCGGSLLLLLLPFGIQRIVANSITHFRGSLGNLSRSMEAIIRTTAE